MGFTDWIYTPKCPWFKSQCFFWRLWRETMTDINQPTIIMFIDHQTSPIMFTYHHLHTIFTKLHKDPVLRELRKCRTPRTLRGACCSTWVQLDMNFYMGRFPIKNNERPLECQGLRKTKLYCEMLCLRNHMNQLLDLWCLHGILVCLNFCKWDSLKVPNPKGLVGSISLPTVWSWPLHASDMLEISPAEVRHHGCKSLPWNINKIYDITPGTNQLWLHLLDNIHPTSWLFRPIWNMYLSYDVNLM